MSQPANPRSTTHKGILLAGGSGSRLFPITAAMNKHLCPIFDKPLIYFPLTTLMLAGIDDILVISGPQHLPALRDFLGDGSRWGIRLSYAEQTAPTGIAEALLIGAKFIDGDPFALILGDNIFYGHPLIEMLELAGRTAAAGSAAVFTYQVADPREYGVLECAPDGSPIAIYEKPAAPKSDRAVTGLYFYGAEAVELARGLKPSPRGELEITDLNRLYLDRKKLVPIHFGRGFVWFDAGTSQSLLQASLFVEILQTRQRTGLAFPEEVAYRKGFIDLATFQKLIAAMPACIYRNYLERLAHDFQEEQR
jgi:glucose-1-phosphate thymidylyltransferase